MNKTALTLGTQVGIQSIGLTTGILVARFLGPNGRGALAAAISWASVIAYSGDFGLPVAYIYAAAREPSRLWQLLCNGFIASIVQWVILGVIGTVSIWFALRGHHAHIIDLAILYLWLYLPLNLLTRYAVSVEQGSGRYKAFNAIRACVPVSYLICLVALIILGHVSVVSVVWANVLSNVATLLLVLVVTVPAALQALIPGQRALDIHALRADLRYGIAAHIGTLQPFNSLQLDVLILTIMISTYNLGLYIAALAGAGVLRAMGSAIGMIVLPEVARRKDIAGQRAVIVRYLKLAVLLGLPAVLIALFWARPLIQFVYGGAYIAAAAALRVMVVGGVLAALYRILADGLRGMGHPFHSTLAELAGLAVGVSGLILITPRLGILGAAIAVAAASFASLAAVLVATHIVWSANFTTNEDSH